MRLTVFLLLAATFQVSAAGYAQNITLNMKNAPLVKVLSEIKKQSGYHVVYEKGEMAKAGNVNINVVNATLDNVLSQVFIGQPLTYKINDKFIMVSSLTAAFQPAEKKEEFTPPPLNIRGRITNDKDEPVAGVSISVKGGKTIGVSDNDGMFNLTNISEKATLIFSAVNIETREIAMASNPGLKSGATDLMLNVSVKSKVNKLDEVQVIAYGTTTRRLSTGNISTVKSADIEKQPVSNPLLALEGRVPGLFITQENGLSGGAITVRVQGVNSISSGNEPLYVIDGVPYPSQLVGTGVDGVLGAAGSGRGTFSRGNPLSYINPSDIESIDVLKDADATAIYGSRAANGAILITTKKGKIGPVKFNLNMQTGWGKVTRKLDMLNTRQYLDMRYEALKNDGITTIPASNYDLKFWDTTRYTDWQKELIGGTAQYTNISANVSGGTALVQYLVGGTYHKETTVFPFPKDFSDQKGSLHFNVNSSSTNKNFWLQLSGNFMVDNNQLPVTDLTNKAILLEPDAPSLYNGDGTLNWAPNVSGTSTFINPLTNLYKKYVNKTNNLVSNLVAGYRILPGFEISSNFGYANMQTNDFSPIPLLAIRPEFWSTTLREAYYGNRTTSSWIIEPQATYKRNIGKGKMEGLLGITIQQNNSRTGFLDGLGYNSDEVLEDIKSAASVSVVLSSVSIYKYNALFGRLNYNWQDKYIINLNARRDGSSRFGAKNQFHNFGSIGAVWLFSKEKFVEKNIRFISFGKLRASYGTTGNDQIGDYSFMSLYAVASTGVPYQNSTGLSVRGLPNSLLQWEETKKLQLAIDLGFLKDNILINATYARNHSSNQLLNYALPTVTGFSSMFENFPATVQNTSWEFSINTVNIKGRTINWTSNINLTIPQNKLVDFPTLAKSTYASSLIIGQPIGIIKAYKYFGVDPSTGQYQFVDYNGNPTFSPNFLTDATVLINTLPKFYGGLQNSFSYKDFQLDFLFQFVKQIGIPVFFNNGSIVGPGVFLRGSSNQPISVLNHWQKPGDIVNIQKYSSDLSNSYTQLSMVMASDAGYSDASYVRLKNLSLSWQLPAKWRHKAHLQNCMIYVQGQNLLTITNYKGMDPENKSISALPPLRMLTVGLQVGL